MDTISHRSSFRFGQGTRLGSIVAAAVLATALPSAAAHAAPQVLPGSVSATINHTSGSPSYSTLAVAAGWYRGSITVRYDAYGSSSSSGPWTYLYSDSNSCSSSTSCSTSTHYGSRYGYLRVVAHASGPGDAAENDPSIKTVFLAND